MASRVDGLDASLTIFSGAMFSKKTRSLIERIRAHNAAGGSAPLVFRPNTDTRDGTIFMSHDVEPLVLGEDEAVVQSEHIRLGGGHEDEILRYDAQVCHHEAYSRRKLRLRLPSGRYAINAVLLHLVEAQEPGCEFPIQGPRSAISRRRA